MWRYVTDENATEDLAIKTSCLAREMCVLRQAQLPNVFTFPPSVVKQEPQSLLKVGKHSFSKEHHITYWPSSPCARGNEGAQGLPSQGTCAMPMPMGERGWAAAHLSSQNRKSSLRWTFPLHGGLAGHPVSHERDRQTAFCWLCAWEMTQQVYSRSSTGQIMCVGS